MKLSTTKGREAEIISYIKQHGRFSVFWASENFLRAVVLTKMIQDGRIIVKNSPGYPFTKARLKS